MCKDFHMEVTKKCTLCEEESGMKVFGRIFPKETTGVVILDTLSFQVCLRARKRNRERWRERK